MRMVLDAGALIGVECSDRRVAGLIALGRRAGADLVTTTPVAAQVWRGGARRVDLARALAVIDVVAMDLDVARSAGELLESAGGSDVVDASAALLARPGDQVLTGDPGDHETLLEARPVARPSCGSDAPATPAHHIDLRRAVRSGRARSSGG